jgi:hypothetical protein
MLLLAPPRRSHRAHGSQVPAGRAFLPAPTLRIVAQPQDIRFAPPIPQPSHIENAPIPSPPISLAGSAISSRYGAPRNTYVVGPSATYSEVLPASASRGEARCAAICMELLAGERVLYNFRDRAFSNPDTNRALELDIFYPTLRFAVEYNGEQHYADTARFGVTSTSQAARDQIKAAKARDYGICLVTIPYTYDEGETRRVIHAAAMAHDVLLTTPREANRADSQILSSSEIPAWVGAVPSSMSQRPVDPQRSDNARKIPPARPGIPALAEVRSIQEHPRISAADDHGAASTRSEIPGDGTVMNQSRPDRTSSYSHSHSWQRGRHPLLDRIAQERAHGVGVFTSPGGTPES